MKFSDLENKRCEESQKIVIHLSGNHYMNRKPFNTNNSRIFFFVHL